MKNKLLPIKEMPRERLEKYGKEVLSIEELIAIIIKTGSKNHSVNDLSRKIVKDISNINDLKEHTIQSLMKYDGIGKIKAIEILSAIELGKRIYQNQYQSNKIKLNSTDKIYNYIKDYYDNDKQELFFCIYLTATKHVIETKLLFKGTLTQSLVHPREIFKEAYKLSAASIICIHNHPSGNIQPSKEDITITNKIVSTGKILGIQVLDHVIIGENKYFSFFENNII